MLRQTTGRLVFWLARRDDSSSDKFHNSELVATVPPKGWLTTMLDETCSISRLLNSPYLLISCYGRQLFELLDGQPPFQSEGEQQMDTYVKIVSGAERVRAMILLASSHLRNRPRRI